MNIILILYLFSKYNMLLDIIKNLIPDKTLKRERIEKACNLVEKVFNNLTENKTLSGYIVVILHILLIVIESSLIIFLDLTNINTIMITLLFICHGCIHLYFGGKGCIITRIERHLLDDKDWYGMITILYKIPY